jgi:hypothetical protein
MQLDFSSCNSIWLNGIARAKVQFCMVGEFHEYQTFIVLQHQLNGINVQCFDNFQLD